MAEIRKFTQGKGGEIAQALARAMGEGVRPATPGDGGRTVPKTKAPASGPTATSGVIWDPFLRTTPANAPRKTQPKPAPDEIAD